ncbi:hypothetical protein [Bartonella sp. B17]
MEIGLASDITSLVSAISAIIAFISMLSTLILGYKNVKTSDKHLEISKEQNKFLESQAKTAEKHIDLLLKMKEEADLGEKLEIKTNSPTFCEKEPDAISILVFIKNPTRRIIKMNHIRMECAEEECTGEGCPFEFIEVIYQGYNSQNSIKDMKIHPESARHINLIKPKTTPELQDRRETDSFNIDPGQDIALHFFIRSKKIDKPNTPVFILEHTSPNDPKKTIFNHFFSHFVTS